MSLDTRLYYRNRDHFKAQFQRCHSDADDTACALKQQSRQAILVRDRQVTATEMASRPNLMVIVQYGVEIDSVDIKTAPARRIFVTNIPDYNAEKEVSEHALTLRLSVQQ